ncbi:hypothetical protein U1Q18_037073 [Sarracenia purpurea var. burkii]
MEPSAWRRLGFGKCATPHLSLTGKAKLRIYKVIQMFCGYSGLNTPQRPTLRPNTQFSGPLGPTRWKVETKEKNPVAMVPGNRPEHAEIGQDNPDNCRDE